MSSAERAFQEFLDTIQTASDEAGFERIARRVTERLGFRWLAYLRLTENAPVVISSYPKAWTKRYFELGYQNLDPVVRQARQQHDLFCWNGRDSAAAGMRQQRRFFEEATPFGIASDVAMGASTSTRGGAWRLLAAYVEKEHLYRRAHIQPLSERPRLASDIVAGKIKGRIVIDVTH